MKTKMRRGTWLFAAVIAISAFMLAPKPASGQSVTFNFEATITDTAGLSAFSVGQTITASYTFNAAVPDLDPTPEIGLYLAVSSWNLTTSGGYSAAATAAPSNGNIEVQNDTANLTRDRYVVNVETPDQTLTGSNVDGLTLEFFTIVLRSSLTTVFPSDALPLVPPSLADFDRGNEFNIGFMVCSGCQGSRTVTATLTSLTVNTSDPVTQISAIVEAVQSLEGDGSLNTGQSIGLQTKLAAAASLLETQPRAALGMLGAFVQHVAALVHGGSLSPEQGQALIAAAVDVIGEI